MSVLPIYQEIRRQLESGGVVQAATWLKSKSKSCTVATENQLVANHFLYTYIVQILNKGRFAEAAHILWGPNVFDHRPESVHLIFKNLPMYSELLVMGAGSLGKSFSMAAWFLMDWIRDPEFTCVKVISATKEHATRNVFAHIKDLHNKSAIKLPGDHKAYSIQANQDERQGIHLIAIPQGDNGAGRLQGFHPVNRTNPHPIFGGLTRVRALLDEAEEIPSGVWEDVSNVLITKHDVEHVKVAAAANPRDIAGKFGQRCEPKEGWTEENHEDGLEWDSKLGFRVVRLDGARCENVVQKKLVYPGFLTWEGYQSYLVLGGAEYDTMARGRFPKVGATFNIITHEIVKKAFGTFEFTKTPTYCASVDLAFEGGDRAILSVGRVGSVNISGKVRQGLELVQQIELPKSDGVVMAENVIRICRELSIEPQWLVCDRTGNGEVCHDLIMKLYGDAVLGVHFAEAATELKIMDEDQKTAAEQYDGIVSEMFFASRKFLEFGICKIALYPHRETLVQELIGRRMQILTRKTKSRVESKGEYKSRGNKSPDYADSFCLLIHLVRMRGNIKAQMLPNAPVVNKPRVAKTGYVDTLDMIPNEGD